MGMYQPTTVQEDIISLYIPHTFPRQPINTYYSPMSPERKQQRLRTARSISYVTIKKCKAAIIDDLVYISGYQPLFNYYSSLKVAIETPVYICFLSIEIRPEIHVSDPTHSQKEMKLRIKNRS